MFFIVLSILSIAAVIAARFQLNHLYEEVFDNIKTKLSEDIGDEAAIREIIKISRIQKYPWEREAKSAKQDKLEEFWTTNGLWLSNFGIDKEYVEAMTKNPIIGIYPLWRSLVTLLASLIYVGIGYYLVEVRNLMSVSLIWMALATTYLFMSIWQQKQVNAVKAYCGFAVIPAVLTVAARGVGSNRWAGTILAGVVVFAAIFIVAFIKNTMIKVAGKNLQNTELTLMEKFARLMTGCESEIDPNDICSDSSLDPVEQEKKKSKFYRIVFIAVFIVITFCLFVLTLNL